MESTDVPGLLRKVEFTSQAFDAIKDFLLLELRDEWDKVVDAEVELHKYLGNKGKKLRF